MSNQYYSNVNKIPLESIFSKSNNAEKQACGGVMPLAYKFIKKRLLYRYFPVHFANFFRKLVFIEHLQWLLLNESRSTTIKQNRSYYTKDW